MTTFILNQKQILVENLRGSWESIEARCAAFHYRDHATAGLAALAGLSLISYVVALYWTFGLGVGIDALKKERDAIERVIAADIVVLQHKHTRLDLEYPEVIGAMERVSQIRYVAPENVAVAALPDTLLR